MSSQDLDQRAWASQLASAVAHGYSGLDVNAVLKVIDPQGQDAEHA